MTHQDEISLVSSREWLLEEQKQRRTELDTLIHSMEVDQRNGVLFTAIAWSWLFSNSDKIFGAANLMVAGLPALVMMFLLYRHRGLAEAINVIAAYTRKLENSAALPEGLGWETYLLELRQAGRWPNSREKRARLLWVALIITNAAAGVIYFYR